MSKRLVVLVVLAALGAVEVHAVGPLGRRRTIRRRTVAPVKALPTAVFRSPEKMTEMFGPSILVRETAKLAKDSKFVTQPD